MTRKTTFLRDLGFKFNYLGLALDMARKFFASVAKALKLKFRKIWRLILMFVTGENLLKWWCFLPPHWIVLKRSAVKSVSGYSNISKGCLLCVHEKFEIANYPNQEELLNKQSELISKCHRTNQHLLAVCESNF